MTAKRCAAFCGIEPGDDRIPDETPILNFRHPPERYGLTGAIVADVNAHLAGKGITLRWGMLVDVSRRTPSVRESLRKIIGAPSSAKNRAGARATPRCRPRGRATTGISA